MKSQRLYFALVSSAALLWLVFALLRVAAAQENLEALEERAMKAAVQRVSDSVVAIESLGGMEKIGNLLIGSGPTTGLIVSEDGYIISSAFNFAQKPSSILVTLPSGKRLSAKIVARDTSRMLVLLKVDTDEKLSVPVVAPREGWQVGQWTLAVGRTYDVRRVNLSVGVLSAKNRIWGKAIQTDAKISPANYGGPLIDIHGRVLGVLVPLSPTGKGEVAGAEWYDSGIGFAIPLADINEHLQRLKDGEDLHPGVMGVSLKGKDMYALKAEVAACPINSPAANAGLKPGDTIVEIDGVKIDSQAQLRHALGTRYSGEKIQIVVLRAEERIETVIELTDKLTPYQHPFLGVLPLRSSEDEKGVKIRFVYPDSPAFRSEIKIGDRLLRLGRDEIPSAARLQEMISLHEPGDHVELTLQRGEESLQVEVALATLPVDIPPELPSALQEDESDTDQAAATGAIDLKLPEEKNECLVYVPSNYRADVPHALVVWLHAPGSFNQKRLLTRWRDHCDRNQMILLAPKAADLNKWQPTEVDFIRKVMDDVINNYHIDSTRVVVHGHQGGGALAYLVAFAHHELVRGVAVIDAAMPVRARPPENDPIKRLAFFTTRAEKSGLVKQVDRGIKRLSDMKFPVTVIRRNDKDRYLNAAELSDLVRWIDALDRI